MKFKRFAFYLSQLEKTDSRNEKTQILATLLKEADLEEVDQVCYLALGRLGPAYEALEFNLAGKLVIKILARAYGQPVEQIESKYKREGDLGNVAYFYDRQEANVPLSIMEVYQALLKVANDFGQGSVERKVAGMASLLDRLDRESVRFVIRIPIGRLRLGFLDATILDALSLFMVGDKSARKEIEQAYNVLADIGKIVYFVKKSGLEGLRAVRAKAGVPIRTAQAERLPTAEKVLEKMEGEAVIEPKMDGFRTQIHLDKKQIVANSSEANLFPSEDSETFLVRAFSRNLENITKMFPDIVRAVRQLKGVSSAIFDCESIAYDPKTGRFLDFQKTIQRKRKYGIKEKVKEVPLRVFVFDLLFLNGRSLLTTPFAKRRQLLEEIFKDQEEEMLVLTEQRKITKPSQLRKHFNRYLSQGLEGAMIKKLDSHYQAGARNFNWVKFKKTTEGELVDTIDCVVMGYYKGKGKRADFGLGAFLVGVLEETSGKIVTLARVGTGLSDQQWQEMFGRCQREETNKRPALYQVHKNLRPDMWTRPKIVVEVMADEITRSPVHTCAQGADSLVSDPEVGLALRFPRLVRFRDKKNPSQITTVEEVLRFYGMQSSSKP
ncbi:ATP-dependent DNA ligase [Patescibacteria group bacterium]